jgi:hypothetical protein
MTGTGVILCQKNLARMDGKRLAADGRKPSY